MRKKDTCCRLPNRCKYIEPTWEYWWCRKYRKEVKVSPNDYASTFPIRLKKCKRKIVKEK